MKQGEGGETLQFIYMTLSLWGWYLAHLNSRGNTVTLSKLFQAQEIVSMLPFALFEERWGKLESPRMLEQNKEKRLGRRDSEQAKDQQVFHPEPQTALYTDSKELRTLKS